MPKGSLVELKSRKDRTCIVLEEGPRRTKRGRHEDVEDVEKGEESEEDEEVMTIMTPYIYIKCHTFCHYT